MTGIYLLGASETAGLDKRDIERIMPARYERAMRCAAESERNLRLAACRLMIDVLGVKDENELSYAGGRPYLAHGPSFSLSHSGELCALAVSEGAVGVDIEKLDESNLIAAPAALDEQELAWIAPAPLERFHILWTRKESIFKAVGGFEDPKRIPSLDDELENGLKVKSMLHDGYALSVCCIEADELSPESIIRM